ncbi:hypothetical protein [Bacillus sp. C1]
MLNNEFGKLSAFIPLFAGSNIPPQNLVKAKKSGGGRAVSKSPIGEG